MNASVGDQTNFLSSRAKRTKMPNRVESESKKESASDLRSRLLDMILESEQLRKARLPVTPFRRL